MSRRNTKRTAAPQDQPPGPLSTWALRIIAATILLTAVLSLVHTGVTATALSWIAGSALLIAYSYHLQLVEREAYWLRIEQWERDQQLQGLIAQNAESQQQLTAAISRAKLPAPERQSTTAKQQHAEEPASTERKRHKAQRDAATRQQLLTEMARVTAKVR